MDLSHAHASQLYRYFSVTEARFGLLTNGITYWFYTDLEASNKMDNKPFFEFNMLDLREATVEELKKFSKTVFDLDNILTTASQLKYTREIRRIIVEQMQEPSEEFVKFVTAQVYSGRMTQPVREQFAQLTKLAFKQVINDQINDRLKSALASESTTNGTGETHGGSPDSLDSSNGETTTDTIITTEEEIEGYHIVRAILRQVVDVKRIAMRDVQSYCGILLDDTNRKPICRLHFNRAQKYVGFFDSQAGNGKDSMKEERLPIGEIDDIYQFAERLKATVGYYETGMGKKLKEVEVAA